MPSQLSATSHAPAADRQGAVLFASGGQTNDRPSQRSSRSHGPAAARQSVNAPIALSSGQAP